MRVAQVTTWGQQCGIATYAEELLTAQLGLSIQPLVLAPSEVGVGIREVSGIPWRSVWGRSSLNLGDELQAYLEGVNIVHFQHEDGLFRQPRAFLQALHQLNKICKVVVTLHTVWHYGGWEGSGFYDDLREVADVIIVHTPEALAALSLARSKRAKLIRIPHGTALSNDQPADRAKGLELLGVPAAIAERILEREVTLGLVQGFQGPSKNTVATIRGFATAISQRLAPKSLLAISGEIGDNSMWWSVMQGVATTTGYGNRIIISPSFVAPHQMQHVMAAADWGVLNTCSWVLSSSGAAHLYAACGVPICVANRPIYYEALQGGAVPFDLEVDVGLPSRSLINSIGALASSSELRRGVGREMLEWAQRTSWENVAKKHLELYKELMG